MFIISKVHRGHELMKIRRRAGRCSMLRRLRRTCVFLSNPNSSARATDGVSRCLRKCTGSDCKKENVIFASPDKEATFTSLELSSSIQTFRSLYYHDCGSGMYSVVHTLVLCIDGGTGFSREIKFFFCKAR